MIIWASLCLGCSRLLLVRPLADAQAHAEPPVVDEGNGHAVEHSPHEGMDLHGHRMHITQARRGGKLHRGAAMEDQEAEGGERGATSVSLVYVALPSRGCRHSRSRSA